MARLLNVFASFRKGRDYLLCSTNLNNNLNSNYGQGRQQLIYECSQTLKVKIFKLNQKLKTLSLGKQASFTKP